MLRKKIIKSVSGIWILVSLLILFPYTGKSQLQVDSTHTVQYLVENILVGAGVSVSNISYTGAALSFGEFTNGNSTNIGLDEGIILSTGNIAHAKGPNSAPNKTTNTLQGSDPQLAALVPGLTIYDASVLEFNFIPMSDTLKFRYVFASDEYPEWVNTGYNDVFGFFVNGLNPGGGAYTNYNIALVPGSSQVVSINTINNGQLLTGPCINCSYYVNNNSGTSIEFDGFTTVLTSWIKVTPCTSYHIKIAIGDVSDHSYDSGVFLEKNSFSSNIPTVSASYSIPGITPAVIEGCNDAKVKFKLAYPATYPRVIHYSIGGSATNGVDYTLLPDSVIVPTGSDSIEILVHPIADGLSEGPEYLQLIIPTSSCSIDTIIIPFEDYTPINLTFSGDTSLCMSETTVINTTVNGGVSPFQYSWSSGEVTSGIQKQPLTNTLYKTTVTDGCGFQKSDSILVNVHSLPQLSITIDDSAFCEGLNTNINVTGALNYSWTPSTSLSSTIGNNVIASPISSITYTIIGTDTFGCKDTISAPLSIFPAPTISINSSSGYICKNDSILLNANGGLSYSWTPLVSLTNIAGNNATAYPSTSTNYQVVGIGANGCKDSSSFLLEVKPLPVIDIATLDSVLCFGDNTILLASGGQNYQWSPSVGLSSSTAQNPNANPVNSIVYSLLGTDIFGCKNIDSIQIIVHPLPQLWLNSSDTFICSTDSILLYVTGAENYSWSPSSGLSTNNNDTVFAHPNGNVLYTIIGTDSNQCSSSEQLNIDISSPPSINPQHSVICIGDSVQITVIPNIANSGFIWNTGEVTNSINAKPIITTTYSVTSTDTIGCVNDTFAIVEVKPLPVLHINPANPLICNGQSSTIHASGAQSFSWSPTNYLNASTGNTVIANPPVTSTYLLTGVSAFGCIDSLSFQIGVSSPPPVEINLDDTIICPGEPVQLIASGAINYVWTPTNNLNSNSGDTVVSNAISPTHYIVTGSDSLGCMNKDTVFVDVAPTIQVSASPPAICLGDSSHIMVSVNSSNVTYIWNTGDTIADFWVKPLITTSYSVTVTDTIMNCSSIGSVNLVVYLLPPLEVNPEFDTICDNETINLTASGAVNYVWSPANTLSSANGSSVIASPDTTITYMIIGSDNHGCKDTVYSQITVMQALHLTLNPLNSTLCAGDSLLLAATGGNNYIWTPLVSSYSVNSDSVYISPITTSDYMVFAVDSNQCRDSLISHIIVNPKPNLSINNDSANICENETFTFNANGANTYLWNPATALTSSTASTVTASPNITTSYTLTGYSSAGCIDSLQVILLVHPLPNLQISDTLKAICPGDSQLIIHGGADQYAWFPNIYNTSVGQDSTLVFPKTSTNYRIIGSTSYGCTDTAFTRILVGPVPYITPVNPQICQGDTIQLIAHSSVGNPGYLWNNGMTNDTILLSPGISQNISLIATDTNGCQEDTNVHITVFTNPAITINPVIPSICPGSAIIIQAFGAINYQWSPSSGLSSTSGNTVTASPANPTTYTVEGTDIHGCKDTIMFPITYNPIPIISTNINFDTICNGDSVMLIATGASSYEWSPSQGLSSTTNDTVWAKPNFNRLYKVVGFNSTFCTDTSFIGITVYQAATINPVNPSICVGDSVKLKASSPISGISYIWSTGSNLDSVYVKPVIPTVYTVTTHFPIGCSLSSQSTVGIYNDPSVNILLPDTSICSNSAIVMNAVNANTYNWSPANGLSATSGSTVTAQPANPTLFKVQGISVHGCISYDSVNLALYSLPQIVLSSLDSLICLYDSTSLNANGATSYIWSPSNGLNQSIGNSVIAYPNQTTTYTVIGTDSNGCSNTNSLVLTIDSGSFVTITPNNPFICAGDTVHLTANGANTYQWTPSLWTLNTFGSNFSAVPLANITYHVTGTNSNGCKRDTFVYINVRRPPLLFVNPVNSSICEGDSIKIAASGAISYSWNPTTGISNPNSDTIYAKPVNNTTYIVTGLSTDGCYKSLTSTVVVHPKPQLNILANPNSYCPGDTCFVQAHGSDNYNWSPASGISSVSDSTVKIFTINSTNYKLVGSSIFGCADSITLPITVYPTPTVSVSASDTSICLNDSTHLNAYGANTYQWQGPAMSSNTGNLIHCSPVTDTTYILIGTNAHGCKDTSQLNIFVNPVPSISIYINKDTICAGDSTLIWVNSATSPISYLWSNGQIQDSIWAIPNSSQYIKATGTNQFGCFDKDSVYVNVHIIPVISMQPEDTILCKGSSLLIHPTLNVGGLNYFWNTGATTQNITVSPLINTSYTLIVSDDIGCGDTAISKVVVRDLPNVEALVNDSVICAYDTINLTAIGSPPPLNFLWNTGHASSYVIQSPSSSNWYRVTVTDSIGCQAKDSVFVLVNNIPTINISPPSSGICKGDSTTLTASSNANPATFYWSTNNYGATQILKPNVTTTFTVKVTDSIGCKNYKNAIVTVYPLPIITFNPTQPEICIGGNSNITANSSNLPSTYLWSTAANTATINVNPIATTTYTVTATDNHNCKSDSDVVLIVHLNPGIQISPANDSICDGDTITLSAISTFPVDIWQWSNNDSLQQTMVFPTSSCTYWVHAEDSNGCKGDDTTWVYVKKRPSCEITAVSPICSGDSSLVIYTGNAAMPYTTNWNFCGAQVFSGNGIQNHSIGWNNAGLYTISLDVTENGCTSPTDTAFIEVFPTPVADFTTTDSIQCYLQPVGFISLNPNMLSYHWDFGNIFSSSDTSDQTNPSFTYPNTGKYSVSYTIVSQNGCDDDTIKIDIIDVHPSPNADFGIDPNPSVISNPLISFNDKSTNDIQWFWDFGDLNNIENNSILENPFHLYSDTGKYWVTQVVYNSFGCTDTMRKIAEIRAEPEIFIPNAFTPDGDGINDFFFPQSTLFDWNTYEMHIFNRWGQMIFKTNTQHPGWDGRSVNNGQNCGMDVYTYTITIKDMYGKKYSYIGKVVLFR